MTRRKVTKTQAGKAEEENPPEQNEEMEDTEEVKEPKRERDEEMEDTKKTKKPKREPNKDEGKEKVVSKKSGGQKKRGGGGGTWEDRIKECKEYSKKHGNCKIPTNYKENKALGIWVQETRRNFKMMMEGKKPRKALSDEQIEELQSIGFDWGKMKYEPDSLTKFETDATWQSNFEKLQEYKNEKGRFDVPLDAEEPYKRLAKWVRQQRHQNYLREGKRKSTLTKERFKKLKGIGFDWYGDRKIEF